MYCNTLLTVIYKYTLQYNYSQYMSQLQPVTLAYHMTGDMTFCGRCCYNLNL